MDVVGINLVDLKKNKYLMNECNNANLGSLTFLSWPLLLFMVYVCKVVFISMSVPGCNSPYSSHGGIRQFI